MHSKPGLLMPALIGGGVFGFIAGVPVINLVNCACCALVIGGGVLAAFLHSKNCKDAGHAFSTGDGALVGLVAAVPYSIVSSIIAGLFSLVIPAGDPEDVIEMLEGMGMDLPPEAMDQIGAMAAGGAAAMIVGFFFSLVIALIFSTVGGLIGGAAFKSEPPPPPPASSTPSYGGPDAGSSLGGGTSDSGSPLGGGSGTTS